MSQFISLQEGIDKTTDYRHFRQALIKTGTTTPSLLPICETFDKHMVTRLLDKPDAQFLRAYLGLEKGEVKLIFVAADAKGCDILPSPNTALTEGDEDEDDELLDRAARCPTECPPASPLNGLLP